MLATPGAVSVLTHADVPAGPMPPFPWDVPPAKLDAAIRPMLRLCHPPLLPGDRVRFVGQAVALVIAETRYAAEDAAERTSIDYDPLPPVPTAECALTPTRRASTKTGRTTCGGALYEEIAYGDDAQLLSVTLADYLVPTAAEVPPPPSRMPWRIHSATSASWCGRRPSPPRGCDP